VTTDKKLLFAIIILVVIIVVATIVRNYWDVISTSFASESNRNILITAIVAPIIVIIVGGLLNFSYKKFLLPFFQGRKLYVNVEKCMHSPAHSRGERHPTGTKMSVTFSLENNLGKRTYLTGVKLIAPKIYETEKEPPISKAPFILPDGSKSAYLEDVTPAHYTHRFFIKGHEILEPKLRCAFRLFYVPHSEKKIKGISKLQQVK